jgi:hypothetical protein
MRASSRSQFLKGSRSTAAPPGGYDDLIRSAVSFDVFGVRLDAASLEDILR